MSNIIGITGLIGSGKDTAANILVNHYGFSKTSFAASLKDAVAAMFHWNREALEGNTNESRSWRECVDVWWAERLGVPHLTPRWVLQHFGTNVCRDHFHTDIWVASLERRLSQTQTDQVISDVRFPNEILAIKRAGGLIVRIQRGELPEWWNTARYFPDHMPQQYPDIHSSEYSWIACEEDLVIHNDGTPTDLKENLGKSIDLEVKTFYNNVVNINNPGVKL